MTDDEQSTNQLLATNQPGDAGIVDRNLPAPSAKTTKPSADPPADPTDDLGQTRGYIPPAGDGPPLPPGRVMVCPKDPTHYRTRRFAADEVIYCPEHPDQRLVPAQEDS